MPPIRRRPRRLLLPPLPLPPEPPRRTLLHTCPVAGFQFHEGPRVFGALAPGDAVDLVREPANPHDRRAVALHWKGRKLGFVPRDENGLASSLMDQGKTLRGTVAALGDPDVPWSCVEVAIWLED